MRTMSDGVRGGRTRRTHSPEFKAQVVAACSAPGMSSASVAMAHGINPNLARRWVRAADRPVGDVAASGSTKPRASAFVPVQISSSAPASLADKLPTQASPGCVSAAPADIRIELRRGALAVSVSWPHAAAAQCAAWLTELLR